MIKYFILFLAAGIALSGCEDKISTLGSKYYSDTIANETSIRNDPGFMQFTDTVRPFVTANGIDFALTDSTTLMIVGKVASGTDNLESWGLLQFLPMTKDTVDSLITGARILLKDENFSYGDTTNSQVSYNVYQIFNTPATPVTDTTYTLPSLSSATVIGAIDTLFPDSTDRVLAIPLNSSVIPNLSASSLSFVIAPMSKMLTARGFGTIHSYGDANSVPQIEYYLKNGDSIFRTPTLSFHLVNDMSTTPTNEFTLRGSTGKRERVKLNLTRPGDTAKLNTFTTINNATLVLHLDQANSAHSNIAGDTIGPDVVQLGLVDSGGHYDGNGYIDPTDPTHTTYRFQVRGMVEQWLRDSTTNLGFELRSGYSGRSFDGASPETIGVEDNTLNRWTFYGPGYSDSTKRPYFILSYSKLK